MSLASGCTTTSDQAYRYYGAERYNEVPVDRVEVLSDEPTRRYTVIADFQSRGESVESMRKNAAAIGAHAIIVTKLGGYRSNNDSWAGEDTHGTTFSRITATVIRYIN